MLIMLSINTDRYRLCKTQISVQKTRVFPQGFEQHFLGL